jgi:CelD/BcsL family acetyltransferase involved in cellulose biosynthesis
MMPVQTTHQIVAYISYGPPENAFWDAYAQLWRSSMHTPPFQGPHYLRFLAQYDAFKVAVFQFWEEGLLKGAAFFREGNGCYRFLSEVRADHNFFVLHQECSQEEAQAFFQHLLLNVKRENWKLILTKHPQWANYGEAFYRAMESCDLFWLQSSISVCPILVAESPADLLSHFEKKRIRYQFNRLQKQKSAVYELFRGSEALDEWVEGLCQAHIKRWEGLPVGTKFQDARERAFFKGCIKAWTQDHTVLRASIRVGDQRIGFNLGLIQENTFIGYTQAFDPNYSSYSPGMILFLVIARWMAEKGLKTFNFGDGGDDYKYIFANSQQQLEQVYIAPKKCLLFAWKAILEKKIRAHPALMRFYRKNLKPYFARTGRQIKVETWESPKEAEQPVKTLIYQLSASAPKTEQ